MFSSITEITFHNLKKNLQIHPHGRDFYLPANGSLRWSFSMRTSGRKRLKTPRAAYIIRWSKSADTLVVNDIPLILLTFPSSIQVTACSSNSSYYSIVVEKEQRRMHIWHINTTGWHSQRSSVEWELRGQPLHPQEEEIPCFRFSTASLL